MAARLAVALAVLLVASACLPISGADVNGTAEPAHTIDWDLSEGHELARINWAEVTGGDQDMLILTDGVNARLRLPEGHTLQERFDRVQLGSYESGYLEAFEGVFDRPLTIDGAHAFAGELAARFDMPMDNFDRWHAQATQAQAANRVVDMTANTNGPRLGPQGPFTSIRTVRSGHEDRPVHIKIALFWDDPDDPTFDEHGEEILPE